MKDKYDASDHKNSISGKVNAMADMFKSLTDVNINFAIWLDSIRTVGIAIATLVISIYFPLSEYVPGIGNSSHSTQPDKTIMTPPNPSPVPDIPLVAPQNALEPRRYPTPKEGINKEMHPNTGPPGGRGRKDDVNTNEKFIIKDSIIIINLYKHNVDPCIRYNSDIVIDSVII